MAKKTARKTADIASSTMKLAMTTSVDVTTAAPADALSSLMAMLEVEETGALGKVEIASEVVEHTEDELNAALAGAESVEFAVLAASPEASGLPGTAEVVEGEKSGKSKTKGKVKKAEKVAAEGEAAAGADKPAPTPRKHYTNKADRIVDRLGDKLPEYTVLTVDAAGALTDEASIKATMDATMDIIRKMNKKEQNRAGFLMEFISGRKASLNEVLVRALKVLHADGVISTGKEGNLLKNLLAKPYTEAAARAMMGNTIGVFEKLQLVKKDAKGSFSANPDSLLLAKANALLGLGS